ncbi:DUF3240 domain-containing protein [Parasulfuritortus cantonensis]|uniref:DUF3240 domain-containing protein n=1 Tax=Parasulfuritortus cantonensis TaxID=2528202 RepID=A0A4V2NW35_9PROT|nr:DUF3240 family protein [Parasulfuritortus cantonensis]TCJ15822.1 DUF3240 domain-containing protein [Parasulfuritortus cantonensis]
MTLVKLSLAAPLHLEDELVEQFLERPEWASGFTIFKAEGYSRHHESLSVAEQVRGRTQRMLVQIVLETDNAEALLEHLRQRFPKRDVAWWLEPVLDFGRLA